MKTSLFWLVVLFAPQCTNAQDFDISWFSIDGGGGASSNGQYAVSGIVGQPDAGQVGGGSYTIIGGFWNIFAVQTPGAPKLSILTSGANALISWSSDDAGDFVLEVTGNLNPPILWSIAPQSPNHGNGTSTVTAPIATESRFYRLKKP